MIKTILKAGFKISILVGFAICVALFASKLTRPQSYPEADNTKEKVDGFYALKDNSIDVLGIGTSHLYSALNPGVFAYYTGLSSYDFAGQCQPMEVTYHYLVEALKTQDPQLVVLDIFALSHEATACQVPGAYRTSIQDLKASTNKLEAYKNMFDHTVMENFFDVSLYANRLPYLDFANAQDIFEHQKNDYFGYTPVLPYSDIIWDREAFVADSSVEPPERRLQAFLKIVALCQSEEIPLLVIKTPYYISQEDANIYRYIWDYCEQNAINYIDFNYLSDELNYQYELDGDLWHATVPGSYKITAYLAQFITNNYQLEPSHNYEQAYDELYFGTLQMIFKTNKHYYRLKEYIDYFDVTVLISDRDHWFSEDHRHLVYKKGTIYPDRYVAYQENSVEIKEDNSVWYNGENVYGPNDEFLMIVVDDMSGKIVDIVNIANLKME
ncbi:MAG: hypothetical protein MR210_03195 [Erysipelotrichaceae bacterium]|nr:hypothetical protein [Erysipelotrichaceae bacterium]MDY5252428.1 hypothetical protein [Erysipelotrichaceae bacterium]